MTSRERRVFKILYAVIIPLAVLAVDVTLYVSMHGWTYYVKRDGWATFWPIVLAFGGLFFPIAAGVAAKALFDLWSARASTRWLVAEGRVTSSTVEQQEHTRRAWVGYETYYEYLPKIAYTYEAGGSSHTNDLTAFGLSAFETRPEAEQMLRAYPIGAPVRVHYDPEDPGTSVLQSVGGWAFKALGGAVLTAIFPFGIAYTLVAGSPF